MMKTLNKYAQRDMYLNIVKEINDKPTSYNSTVKSWKFFFYQEQDKDAHSHHFYSTWYWKSQPQLSGKKKDSKLGKSETYHLQKTN